jgi:nuclear protein localization family protein 4
VAHGDVLHLLYHFERAVAPPKLSDFDRRPFGAHMTVGQMVAAQTRIERQDAPRCGAVSFESHAANAFQAYVASALAFSIKRGGLLYGTVDEETGEVRAHAIFEPPQRGSADRLRLERGGADEAAADGVAAALGWRKVGWIFTQSTKEREFIMSGEEIAQMAAVQAEMGPHAVTALVALFPAEQEGAPPEVHFEAFQVSEQCVRLWQEGWFVGAPPADGAAAAASGGAEDQTGEPSGTSTLRDPNDPGNAAPVIVAGKDAGEVDNDYFLLPVGIKDHEGPLGAAFPVENRLTAQGAAELRAALQRGGGGGQPYARRLADFHLLLYLARQPNFEAGDVAAIVGAVASGEPLPEGYTIIIDSLAGL